MRRTVKIRLVAVVFASVLILLGAGDDSTRVDKLGHRMMCACGCNQILLECNHVGCPYSSVMTNELKAGVDGGKSDRDVLQFFVEKYGTIILAAPSKEGFDRVAWIMPYLALLLGVGGVVLAAGSWRKRRAGLEPAVPGVTAVSDLDTFRAQARKDTEI